MRQSPFAQFMFTACSYKFRQSCCFSAKRVSRAVLHNQKCHLYVTVTNVVSAWFMSGDVSWSKWILRFVYSAADSERWPGLWHDGSTDQVQTPAWGSVYTVKSSLVAMAEDQDFVEVLLKYNTVCLQSPLRFPALKQTTVLDCALHDLSLNMCPTVLSLASSVN